MGRKPITDDKKLTLSGQNAVKVLAGLLKELSTKEIENLAEQLLINDCTVDQLLDYCRDPKSITVKHYDNTEINIGKNVYIDIPRWLSEGSLEEFKKKGLPIVHNQYLLVEIVAICFLNSSPDIYIIHPTYNNLVRVYHSYLKSIEDVEGVVNTEKIENNNNQSTVDDTPF